MSGEGCTRAGMDGAGFSSAGSGGAGMDGAGMDEERLHVIDVNVAVCQRCRNPFKAHFNSLGNT